MLRLSRSLLLVLITVTVSFGLSSGRSIIAQSGADPVINATGFVTGRDYYSPLPFEHIDSATGGLMLSFTDCELPGNAGWNLAFTRTYNSTTTSWSFGIAGLPLTMAYPTAMPEAGAPGDWGLPTFFTADGGEHIARWTQLGHTGTIFMTKEFWRYDSQARTLSFPNGVVAQYEEQSPKSARLSGATDAFDNHVAFYYAGDGKLERVAQEFAQGERNVTFTYDATSGSLPKTMSCVDPTRTWTYTYEGTPPLVQLKVAAPPEPPSWTYGYTGVELTSVTTPHGGLIEYQFQNHEFEHDAEPDIIVFPPIITTTRRVIQRRTIGTDVWSFEYGAKTDLDFTIKGPTKDVLYNSYYDDESQIVPRVRTTKDKQGTPIQTETLEHGRRLLFGYRSGGSSLDARVAVQTKRIIDRNQRTYITNYGYRLDTEDYADYGHPNSVAETGHLDRTTSIVYKHDFTPYIRARVETVTTTVGTEQYTQGFGYVGATGFQESRTQFGITTTFEPTPDGKGNVGASIDALGHRTTYSYEWGVLKDTATPKYTIIRTINPTGTVASEQRPHGTTSFTYDKLDRVRLTTPPAGAPIDTSYATDGHSMTETRGVSLVTTELDGFGRPIRTVNTKGVETKIEYNSDGDKEYESQPFDGVTPEKGEVFIYDEIGRVRKVTHTADGSFVTYDYDATSLTITDENGHATRQERQSFGDPDEARISKVTAAAGTPDARDWLYGYDAIGNLKRVDQPDAAPIREWTYDPGSHRMRTETHPESGQTSFDYDVVGNMTKKTDALSREYIYSYDSNNRLTKIDGPGTEYDVDFNYNSFDQRTVVKNGVVDRALEYVGGRLTKITDVFVGTPHTLMAVFEYDDRDNLIEVAYPNGREIVYDYDSANRVEKVWERDGQTFAKEFAYHPSGAVKSMTFENGQVESIDYDGRARPTKFWSGDHVHLRYDEYDPVGNVKKILDQLRGTSFDQTLTYDGLDRLKTITGMGTNEFTYDALGNRLSKLAPNLTYTYDATTKRLTSVSGDQSSSEVGTYTYDGVGNLREHDSSHGTRSYTYTASNMMETATVNGATTLYWYDGDNIRARKRTGTDDPRYFVHGPTGNLLSEYDEVTGALRWERDYIYLGSRLLASITAPPPTPPCTTPDVVNVQGPYVVKAGTVAQFTVSLPAAVPHDVIVDYSTAHVTTSTNDYTAASGTLTFLANTTTPQTVNVPTTFDAEKDETFTFNVGGTCVVPASTTTMIRNRPKGDLDGDGDPEIIWQNISSGNLAIWRMSGVTYNSADPNNTIVIAHAPEWEVVAMGDFNHDGYQDFVEQNTVTGAGRVLKMQNTQQLGFDNLPAGLTTNWKIRGVGDYNDDTNDDIVLHHTDGWIGVWRMSGINLVTTGTTDPDIVSSVTWNLAGAPDLNGDRKADFVWQANPNGWLAYWFMNGVIRQSYGNLAPDQEQDTNWKIKAVADYNVDGKPDLIWHHQTSGLVSWWLMNGTSLASAGWVVPTNPPGTVPPGTYRLAGPR